LIYRSTSGNGTTGADHIFQVGNNGGTEAMRILNNGNVGIGTNNPTSLLNIAGGGVRIASGLGNTSSRPSVNTSTIGNYEIRGVGGGTSQNDTQDDGFLRLSAGGGTNAIQQSSIDLSGYSNTVSDMNSNIVMRTAGVERLRINNAGNVGIGTSSPTEKLEVNGNVKATNFIGNGSQLSNVLTKATSSWVLTAGPNTVNFSVTPGGTYAMWVYGNVPNGIVMWNATVTTANTNVPVVGSQYGWYYSIGNALVLTSMPSQIIGTAGSISTSCPVLSNSNIFSFGITNNSGGNQTIYWGYTRLD